MRPAGVAGPAEAPPLRSEGRKEASVRNVLTASRSSPRISSLFILCLIFDDASAFFGVSVFGGERCVVCVSTFRFWFPFGVKF